MTYWALGLFSRILKITGLLTLIGAVVWYFIAVYTGAAVVSAVGGSSGGIVGALVLPLPILLGGLAAAIGSYAFGQLIDLLLAMEDHLSRIRLASTTDQQRRLDPAHGPWEPPRARINPRTGAPD